MKMDDSMCASKVNGLQGWFSIDRERRWHIVVDITEVRDQGRVGIPARRKRKLTDDIGQW